MRESRMKSSAALPVRVAADRGPRLLGFLTIFAAALAGFSGAGVWTIGACAIALASISYAENYHLYRRGQELGLIDVLRSTVVSSLLNALMAAGGAYICGAVLRML